ncbi:MAG: hypothetical protein ABJK37_07105 [Paraglaciecola sp.]|uniref:hypothetical protein n=1 Tax=Paraglaciecola sp. TaxID=1920173 RepID=UPI003297CE58
MESNSHLSITFNGSSLKLDNVKKFGGKSEVFKAVSGNQSSEPIPKGTYWIYSSEIHKMSFGDDWTPRGFSKPTVMLALALKGKVFGCVWNGVMLHMSAWGEFRIPIRQSLAQRESTGRYNMFIHGGDSPGSAGCIDLGHQISIFVAVLKNEHTENEKTKIRLNVV